MGLKVRLNLMPHFLHVAYHGEHGKDGLDQQTEAIGTLVRPLPRIWQRSGSKIKEENMNEPHHSRYHSGRLACWNVRVDVKTWT